MVARIAFVTLILIAARGQSQIVTYNVDLSGSDTGPNASGHSIRVTGSISADTATNQLVGSNLRLLHAGEAAIPLPSLPTSQLGTVWMASADELRYVQTLPSLRVNWQASTQVGLPVGLTIESMLNGPDAILEYRHQNQILFPERVTIDSQDGNTFLLGTAASSQLPMDATVLLNFDDPFPYQVVGWSIFGLGDKAFFNFLPGNMPTVTEALNRSNIASTVEQVFAGAGVTIDVVTDQAHLTTAPDAVVYFSTQSPDVVIDGRSNRVNGRAESVDRFNRVSGDIAITFVNGRTSERDIAITTAHEIGHLFGLIHHKEGEGYIMYPGGLPSRAGFLNGITTKTGLALTSHNPAYHLQEFTGQSAGQTTLPGTYDSVDIADRLYRLLLDTIAEDIVLHDMMVLGGLDAQEVAADSFDVLDLGLVTYSEAITTSALTNVVFNDLFPDTDLALVASTKGDGVFDVYLNNLEGERIISTSGLFTTEVMLQRVNVDGSETTIGFGRLVAIPEPNTLALLAIGSILGAVFRLRHYVAIKEVAM